MAQACQAGWLARRPALRETTAPRPNERASASELPHPDTKKLARFEQPGHRDQQCVRFMWECFVHSALKNSEVNSPVALVFTDGAIAQDKHEHGAAQRRRRLRRGRRR